MSKRTSQEVLPNMKESRGMGQSRRRWEVLGGGAPHLQAPVPNGRLPPATALQEPQGWWAPNRSRSVWGREGQTLIVEISDVSAFSLWPERSFHSQQSYTRCPFCASPCAGHSHQHHVNSSEAACYRVGEETMYSSSPLSHSESGPPELGG